VALLGQCLASIDKEGGIDWRNGKTTHNYAPHPESRKDKGLKQQKKRPTHQNTPARVLDM